MVDCLGSIGPFFPSDLGPEVGDRRENERKQKTFTTYLHETSFKSDYSVKEGASVD